VIDLQKLQLLLSGIDQRGEQLGRDLVARLGADLAGLDVDDILGDVAADQRPLSARRCARTAAHAARTAPSPRVPSDARP
jgi:hypothetical protein